MSNSSLAKKEILSPFYSDRTEKICKITPHHAACIVSATTLANIFTKKNRNASCNYAIGKDGEIILVVPENKRAWTSSSRWNDQRAVTVEISNDGGKETNWHISDASIEAFINLAVDICKRNGMSKVEFTGDKNGSITFHRMFAATTCPGPYLESKIGSIVKEINTRLNPPKTEEPKKPAKKSAEELAELIIAGKYGNGDARVKNLLAEGYTNAEIKAAQDIVNKKYKVTPAKPSTPSAPASATLKPGNLVKFNASATKWATGQRIPSWVKAKTLYVRSEVINGKVSVSTLRIGAITGVAYVRDLKKV